MIVFVESNFVLEWVRQQEEHLSCEELLGLAEAGAVQVVLPAYSFVEPIETLSRRRLHRSELAKQVRKELELIRRSKPYAVSQAKLQLVERDLVESSTVEQKRFEVIQRRLLSATTVIALDAEIIAEVALLRARLDLPEQD